jgi:RNA polymerase sigma-70 factor (ECF subfamily)
MSLHKRFQVITPLQEAIARKLVTDMDLLRLKSIARVYARGLPPDISWTDLLQEAMARVLNGTRRAREGVPVVAFFAGVMRSIRNEHWRRVRRQRRADDSAHAALIRELELVPDAAADPERTLLALSELEAIARLFADDPVALQIIAALGDGLLAEEIRTTLGLTRTEYDSARKRMRRALLREGMRWVVA